MTAQTGQWTVEQAVAAVRDGDAILTGLATGQASGLLSALGLRDDLRDVTIYAGIFTDYYAFLEKPGFRILSGFYGPVERLAAAAGANIDYIPSDFIGVEDLALRMKPRIVWAPVSPPDKDGNVTLGLYSGASYRAFLEAALDPDRIAIAEVQPGMPSIGGLPEFGDNQIALSAVDAWVESDKTPYAVDPEPPNDVEMRVAANAVDLIPNGATLQFGIGRVPNEIARLLSEDSRRDVSIHSEMISDGVMHLHEAGTVENRKAVYDGVTTATFALGSRHFYDWLDGNPEVRMLPVSEINDACIIRRLDGFVSINGALAIDLTGQVVAEHAGGRQYSGIGGHESFVLAATESTEGRSLLCLPSTTAIDGKPISRISTHTPSDAKVTTPRQHVQWIVTEYGAVNLYGMPQRERSSALIEIAHTDFRDELRASI
jgi:acyl-CoA hydrolase